MASHLADDRLAGSYQTDETVSEEFFVGKWRCALNRIKLAKSLKKTPKFEKSAITAETCLTIIAGIKSLGNVQRTYVK